MTDRLKPDAETGCSISEVAGALGLTPRRLQQLVSAGILPRPCKRGVYDLSSCTRAYAKYQRKELRQLRAKKGKKKPFAWPVKKVSKEEVEVWQNEFEQTVQKMTEQLAAYRRPRP